MAGDETARAAPATTTAQVKVKLEEQPGLDARASEQQLQGGPTAPSTELQRLSELLLESTRARLEKRRAVSREDFAEAGRLKRREAELSAQIEKARKEAVAGGGTEERQRLEEAKRRAVAEEDFAEAGRLKKRLRLLEEQGAGGEATAVRAWAEAILLAQAAGDGPALVEELQAVAPPGASAAAATAEASLPRGSAVLERAPRWEEERSRQQAEAVQRDDKRREQGEERERRAEGAREREADRHGQHAKEEEPVVVKAEEDHGAALVCTVPGRSVQQLLAMSKQDVWQHAWNITWQESDALGQASDQAQVYAKAQDVWKGWLAERDRLAREHAMAEERRKAGEVHRKAHAEQVATTKAVKEEQQPRPKAAGSLHAGLSEGQLAAQEAEWRESESARADWRKLTAEAEKRRMAKEAPRTGRDLCAVVKQRCPADQPLQFERLLAVCPKGTTVRQLMQAMAREPQDFRRSFDGGEYCVRPVNSRCVDWLPVQAAATPPGFREDASLPEEMLAAAKSIFEERLKPQGQAAEDPLAQFLSAPNRLPPDTPLPFEDVLRHCPPGTKPFDLVKTMSKRRDLFRQDTGGKLFCVRPRARCKDWAAVNPYLDPLKLKPAPSAAAALAGAAHKLEPAGSDD